MDTTSLLTGGGVAGLLGAAAYLGRLALDWRKEKRAAPRQDAAASITDAATANAVLVQSLDALRAENQRMARKIKHLEDEAEAKDAKIGELERRVQEILDELAALKAHR